MPAVLSTQEVSTVINCMPDNTYCWVLKTIYGCGLRLKEALNLRVKDIGFDYNRVVIWDSKSLKDRSLPLPQKMIPIYTRLISDKKVQHEQDLKDGFGTVEMPNALARKYPNADKELKWQF